MAFGHCSCPDCGTTLRIRDRSFVGRVVPCPECHTALLIELDHNQHVAARKPPLDKSAAALRTSSTSIPVLPTVVVETSSPRRTFGRWRTALGRISRSPLAMAWALALAMTALVVVAMTRPAVRFRSGPQIQPSRTIPPETSSDDPSKPDAASTDSPPPDSVPHISPTTESPLQIELPLAAADALHPANAPALSPESTTAIVSPPVAVAPPNPVPAAVIATPKIDFELLLNQRFTSFEQAVPVSRRALLEFLEELLGGPIQFNADELGEQNLNKLVTVRKLENTTVSKILKTVLDPAGWDFVTDDVTLHIRLKLNDATPPKPK